MRLHIPRSCESEMFSLRSRVPLFRDRPAVMNSLSEIEQDDMEVKIAANLRRACSQRKKRSGDHKLDVVRVVVGGSCGSLRRLVDDLCKNGGKGKSQSSAEWDVVQIRRSCDVHENPEL